MHIEKSSCANNKYHIYICLCDSHRPRTLRGRQARGRYVVCAKNEKEALKLLRSEIRFGSIQVYYQQDDYHIQPKPKTVVKEI